MAPEPKVKSLTEAQKAALPAHEAEHSAVLALMDGEWRAATVLKVTYTPVCFVLKTVWDKMTVAEKEQERDLFFTGRKIKVKTEKGWIASLKPSEVSARAPAFFFVSRAAASACCSVCCSVCSASA